MSDLRPFCMQNLTADCTSYISLLSLTPKEKRKGSSLAGNTFFDVLSYPHFQIWKFLFLFIWNFLFFEKMIFVLSLFWFYIYLFNLFFVHLFQNKKRGIPRQEYRRIQDEKISRILSLSKRGRRQKHIGLYASCKVGRAEPSLLASRYGCLPRNFKQLGLFTKPSSSSRR